MINLDIKLVAKEFASELRNTCALAVTSLYPSFLFLFKLYSIIYLPAICFTMFFPESN